MMTLPPLATDRVPSVQDEAVIHLKGSLAFPTGAQAAEIIRRAEMFEKLAPLLDALEALTGMAESFPTELFKGHPNVVKARQLVDNAKEAV
jgi:hypothetical protein